MTKTLDEILRRCLVVDTFSNGNGVQVVKTRFSSQAKAEILAWGKEQRKDPFDFVEPCVENCTKERHAYHQGQWDMATRMTAELTSPTTPSKAPYQKTDDAEKEQRISA